MSTFSKNFVYVGMNILSVFSDQFVYGTTEGIGLNLKW
jgi:hypothetical protein